MLCKAAVMQDYASFDAIARSKNPKQAKALGRLVGPWKQPRWDRLVCDVALEAVRQKFFALPNLASILLATGDSLIAEMTRNDANWGTGIDVGHANANKPSAWPGTNILGWALIVTRAQLVAQATGAANSTASGAANGAANSADADGEESAV